MIFSSNWGIWSFT